MKGVLLVNLGTPKKASVKGIYHYLKEFLMDARVIDLPAFFRLLLVNFYILPKRTKQATKAYKSIWKEKGSPLLIHTHNLTAALREKLGLDYQINYAMRYGEPTISEGLSQLKSCSSLIIIPLFPQYSSAATGSALEKTLSLQIKQWNIPKLYIINHFYNHPDFIQAYVEQIKQAVNNQKNIFLLFSYHGLPERHIYKSHCKIIHDNMEDCLQSKANLAFCYKAQCYITSDLIAKKLNLPVDQYAVSFQSRLGRRPWIKPYTDFFLKDLIKKGIKKIAVVCPSFVADCLETLEEVDIRTRVQWQQLGGEEFIFVPCLNDSPVWVEALSKIILEK